MIWQNVAEHIAALASASAAKCPGHATMASGRNAFAQLGVALDVEGITL